MRTEFPPRGLYAITPEHPQPPRSLPDQVAQALQGGARIVQYRDKSQDLAKRLAEARALMDVCRHWGVPLLINDDVELAAAVGAAGVHLGRDDLDLAEARARLGPGALIGVSCYDQLALAERAQAQGADYVAFGRFFPSATKPGAVPASLDLLRRARVSLSLPLVAIGGITPQNGGPLIRAGADLLAAIEALFGQADIQGACRAFADLFQNPRGTAVAPGAPPAPCPPPFPRGTQMTRSHDLFHAAQQHIPGGVNSPVRAFRGVGGDPLFIERGAGPFLFDADGNRYIDYVGSWGPLILGHAAPEVLAAVSEAIQAGLSFGAPTEIETRMAAKLCELVPSMEMVRMVSSGTEATMSAIRLARGFTRREKILKFEGCYHGHSDSLLVKAGSGALTLGEPSSPGVPKALAKLTLTLNYNDSAQARECFAEMGDEIACVIVEPVAGNMNCIPPQPGFLETLRELCDRHGSLLIFDEVMTGFRVALGGAQGLYGITPDLTTLGKVIGGGMPVGAFGGRRAVMEQLAPLGPVYQAGTLSGNPVAMAAGLRTLELIAAPGFFDELGRKTQQLTSGLEALAKAAGVPFTTNRVGGMFGLFFTEAERVTNFAEATACDVARFRAFFHAMRKRGVYLAPSAFEAGFVSIAHGEAEIGATLAAAAEAFAESAG